METAGNLWEIFTPVSLGVIWNVDGDAWLFKSFSSKLYKRRRRRLVFSKNSWTLETINYSLTSNNLKFIQPSLNLLWEPRLIQLKLNRNPPKNRQICIITKAYTPKIQSSHTQISKILETSHKKRQKEISKSSEKWHWSSHTISSLNKNSTKKKLNS